MLRAPGSSSAASVSSPADPTKDSVTCVVTELVYSDGTSRKFWRGWVFGCHSVAHWGRVGTKGQTKAFTHRSPGEASASVSKSAASKTLSGYSYMFDSTVDVDPMVLFPATFDGDAAGYKDGRMKVSPQGLCDAFDSRD
jgi:predicted DNA-binding WGR domain protein